MKDLSRASKDEIVNFFNSVEYVLSDVDGALRRSDQPIFGAKEAIKTLKNLNKKVFFVSNNNTISHEQYYQELKSSGFDLSQNDLIIPVLAMVNFLKKNNYSKKIYLIGMTPMREHLENAGYQIEDYHYENPQESTTKFVKDSLSIKSDVGAVVVDFSLNLNVAELQRAITYLKNPEIIFITGGQDKKLIIGPEIILIGPGCFHNILEEMSGRKPHCLAKPSLEYNDFIKEKVGITDPKKVLFIGDLIPEDMGFATNSGYKKLLVLSGLTGKEAVNGNWTFPEEYKPDYYIDSLQNLENVLSQVS